MKKLALTLFVLVMLFTTPWYFCIVSIIMGCCVQVHSWLARYMPFNFCRSWKESTGTPSVLVHRRFTGRANLRAAPLTTTTNHRQQVYTVNRLIAPHRKGRRTPISFLPVPNHGKKIIRIGSGRCCWRRKQ
jgi:hypothetical protein